MFKARPTLAADYEHLYSGDPAFDRAHPAFDHSGWIRTGKGEHLPMHAGATPVKFRLRHLKGRERRHLMDFAAKHGHASALYEACALALQEVIDGRTDAGTPVKVTHSHDEGGRRKATEDVMELLESVDTGALVHELGGRVFRETFGDPTSARE